MKKIKASTLVETLTAASILSIVAGLAILIFLKLSSPNSNGAMLLNAQQISYEYASQDIFTVSEVRDSSRGSLNEESLFCAPYWEWKGEKLKEQRIEVEDLRGNVLYQRKRLYYAR